MPRSNRPVKPLSSSSPFEAHSPGLVDLHFHGAFGCDFADPHHTATLRKDSSWQEALAARGLAGFCPTLLSLEPARLREAVAALGTWIRLPARRSESKQARPLGIHLEGPFLAPDARGAHPASAVRPFQPEALEALWELSLGTLRILTIAPEILYPAKLRWLARFAARTGIRLNMGHSRATQAQAEQAVAAGFTGVTHAWNAMAFHHREPGILGATLGNPAVTLELIPDHWHVHPTVLRWTRILHPQTAWVSDCTPASETRGAASFGPLRVFHSAGASRLGKGSSAPLAGGGPLLPEQLRQHLNSICKEAPPLSTADFQRLIRTEITQAAHRQPLRFLGYSGRAVPPLPLHWVQAPQTPHRESQITLTIG